MNFSEVSKYFQKLEQTSSRLTITDILCDLFKKVDALEIDKICYLTQGRVVPLFVPLEFGMAEKMIVKAISLAYGESGEVVNKLFKKIGDLGKVAEELSANRVEVTRTLNVNEVFETLKEIALFSGQGSVERKTTLLSDLLKKLDPLSARFIVRIPIAKMRLGFSDMTVLDALSYLVTGNKEKRKELETAYNVRPDLGLLAKMIKAKGMKGVSEIGPEVGTPILMARAERLSSGKEIIEKIGKCAIEPKLDGFRLQVHYSKNSQFSISNFQIQNERLFDEVEQHVKLYTRNLEDVTHMYPDIVKGVLDQVKADEVIFEGEAIAYDPDSGEYLPFQETVQRKRKYDILEMSKKVPLKLIVFDILYVNKINMIDKPYLERRKKLEATIA